MSRQDEITAQFERAIVEGELVPGDRLPTVRQLSAEVGVSGATVAAAYRTLQDRGLVRGEVGRGTFVALAHRSQSPHAYAPRSQTFHLQFDGASRGNWRRRAVSLTSNRLKTRFPDALDCTSGKPDPHLLPVGPLRRAWVKALDETEPADWQYAGPDPVPVLDDVLRHRLREDGITVDRNGLIIGSSAQQLMILSLSVVSLLNDTPAPTVLVEEPGFQTVFDAIERSGGRLVGLMLDDEGVTPAALDQTITAHQADAVLFTPRAQNPTGRSWSPARRAVIADVLARHPRVVAIEDDQIAELALAAPGSLINDLRLRDRIIYIRSFSKAIAPDLRLAAALAAPRLSGMLAEAKSFSDGWSSRLAQRALAAALEDPETTRILKRAKATYARRRHAVLTRLEQRLSGLGVRAECQDGLNVWIRLTQGYDASQVVDRAAECGVLVVSGEPFFVHPGNDSWIRISVSQLTEDDAAIAADRFADSLVHDSPRLSLSVPV